MDANAFALKVRPAPKALGLLIRTAQWMGEGKAPKREAAKKERFFTELREDLDPPYLCQMAA
jgi:hypothetical protein